MFTVKAKEAGTRLDSFVSLKIEDVSRSFISKLCNQDKIFVNGTSKNSKYKLKENDQVDVRFDFVKQRQIPRIKLELLYEDDDCLVINKPAGILTHSKGAFNPEATVATFIATKIDDLDGDRAGIVHRLDRGTSGVIICAKTPSALSWLQKQFSQRKTKKTYYALVEGHLNPQHAIIDIPIERHPRNPKIFRTSSAGKTAQTEYEVIKSSPHYSLVKLMPKTGRTHQLRVHLKHIGHPIIGDIFYEGKTANRLYLHAESLEITLPNHQRKVFTVALPGDFDNMIDNDEKISSSP